MFIVSVNHDGMDSWVSEYESVENACDVAKAIAITDGRYKLNSYRVYEIDRDNDTIGDIVAIFENNDGIVTDIFDGEQDNW